VNTEYGSTDHVRTMGFSEVWRSGLTTTAEDAAFRCSSVQVPLSARTALLQRAGDGVAPGSVNGE